MLTSFSSLFCGHGLKFFSPHTDVCLVVLCTFLGGFWAFWERDIFSQKDRLNWGKFKMLQIWWIWKIEIWSEELVNRYQTVCYQPGALIWGGQLSPTHLNQKTKSVHFLSLCASMAYYLTDPGIASALIFEFKIITRSRFVGMTWEIFFTLCRYQFCWFS